MSEIKQNVSGWFGLTYANYLTIPRLSLQAMPEEWQERFIAMLSEMDDAKLIPPHTYEVRRRGDNGRFIYDPWSNYRRGSVARARLEDGEPS